MLMKRKKIVLKNGNVIHTVEPLTRPVKALRDGKVSGELVRTTSPRGDRIAVPASGSEEYPRRPGGYSYHV